MIRFILFLSLFLLIAPLPATALDAQVAREIVRAADSGAWTSAQARAQKSGPEAQALYEWLNLLREDEDQPLARYLAFLTDHPDWPNARRIRAHAEKVITPDTPARDILALYPGDTPPVSGRGAIALVKALQASGQEAAARTRLNNWFIEAGLVRAEQDQIMHTVKPLLTRDTLARRLDHLLNDGQDEMATALAARMGGAYPALARARLLMQEKSKRARDAVAALPREVRADPGFIFDHMKWLRRTDRLNAARDVLLGLPDTFRPYDSKTFWNEQETIVELLLQDNQIVPAYKIATRPFHDDRYAVSQTQWWGGYIAFSYLHQPGRAFKHFDALYKGAKSPLTRTRAAYWAGRASEKLTYTEVANVWYRLAATRATNFYGQLAGKRLGRTVHVVPVSPPIASAEARDRFHRLDLVRLARSLQAAGDTPRARLFIWRLADIYADEGPMLRLVVDVALELKMLPEAVKISRQAASNGIDFADLVYPTLRDIKASGIEPALMYAIIRQESAFDLDAVSSSGARGLMQLMPSTARAVARQQKMPVHIDWLTTRAAYNVRLGSAYLHELVDRFDGSYAFAAAGYNAGPSRVSEWVADFGDPRRGQIDLADWIERIPLNETRNYVQRILEGVVVYRAKLGVSAQTPVEHLR